MAGIIQAPEVFGITPHKVSVCVLLQVYAGPNRACVPYPFSTVSQHNRLGLFLLAHTKSCDDIVDPKLEDLISQLRTIFSSSADWLLDHLTSRLSSLSSPDDLFNFFADMRGQGLDCPICVLAPLFMRISLPAPILNLNYGLSHITDSGSFTIIL
ncbi:hypothetical protein CRG98_023938 [Punica granatum]|uniref:Uncharacterized protein n=1 Tax=Punica granatum TaxID=22663 RepID=A0A2I0JHJ8_PUNGR|nr:hypothetical protein CRG98_023938 [Punica granatum]